MSTLTQTCKTCGAEKELKLFPLHKTYLNGHSKHCFDCMEKHNNRDRRCTACQEIKPADAFSKTENIRNRRRSQCKTCRKKKKIYDAWREKNKEKIAKGMRLSGIKRLFGIDAETYASMLEQQGHACAICKEPCKTGRNLAVDHNHETGKVRGLLCNQCNVGIGNLRDDPKLLLVAVSYLKENNV